MALSRFLLYYFVYLQVLGRSHGMTNKDNPVNEQHLRILPHSFASTLKTTRNSTGQIVSMNGTAIYVIDWLSKHLNFTYSFINDRFYDPNFHRKSLTTGLMYLVDGRADMFLGSYIGIPSEFIFLDYPCPWLLSRYVIMIPIPKISTNFAAIWKPFSFGVWTCLLASFALVLVTFYSLRHFMRNLEQTKKSTDYSIYNRKYPTLLYMTYVLMSQGGWFSSRRLPIRLAAATWCLSGCVLVLAYYSVVIAFVTSPNYVPLIKSFEDIVKKPGVYLTVVRDYGVERKFLETTEGNGKLIGDMLRKYPYLRKATVGDCFNLVRQGSAVYIQEMLYTQGDMLDDFRRVGRCDFTLAKETIEIIPIIFPTAKNSPYTEQFSRSIMRMDSAGLITWWNKEFYPPPEQCINWNRPLGLTKLSLRGLSGAFFVLGIGFILSFVSLFLEKIFKYFTMKKRTN